MALVVRLCELLMNIYFALVADIRFLHEARFYPLIRWPKLFDHYSANTNGDGSSFRIERKPFSNRRFRYGVWWHFFMC